MSNIRSDSLKAYYGNDKLHGYLSEFYQCPSTSFVTNISFLFIEGLSKEHGINGVIMNCCTNESQYVGTVDSLLNKEKATNISYKVKIRDQTCPANTFLTDFNYNYSETNVESQ